jgi:hypothetical protein
MLMPAAALAAVLVAAWWTALRSPGGGPVPLGALPAPAELKGEPPAAAPHAGAEAPSMAAAPSGAELQRLAVSVEMLAARLDAVERALSQADGPAGTNASRAAERIAVADPQAERAARAERVQRLEQAFELDGVDEQTGDAVASEVAQMFEAQQDDESDLLSVACGETMCRIVVEAPDPMTASRVAPGLASISGLSRAMLSSEPRGERVRITAHLSREGHDLPM